MFSKAQILCLVILLFLCSHRCLGDDNRAAEFRERIELAYQALESDDLDGAQQLGETVVKEYPEQIALDEFKSSYVFLQMDLGMAFAAQNRWDESVACYRAAYKISPTDPNVGANLGLALLTQNNPAPDEALGVLHSALTEDGILGDKNELFAHIHGSIGIALRALGRDEEAIPEFKKAIELSPSAMVSHNLAETYIDLGLLDDAIAYARRAADLEPDSAARFGTRIAAARSRQAQRCNDGN